MCYCTNRYGEIKKVYCANSSKQFKNISNMTIMPECGHFQDDDIQGQPLSQGHCKDYVGISASIRLLLLNSVSIGDIVVKKCGDIFSCIGLTDALHCQ